MRSNREQGSGNRPGNTALTHFAAVVAGCTLGQLVAGALVTSREAGLSVPDWPLAYGRLIPRLDGGIGYEFTHRVMAVVVTLLTATLAVWLWRAEDRYWLKPLGFFALGLILLQIVLGGIAVLTLLPPAVSTLHACIAELFFCLMCAIWAYCAMGRNPALLLPKTVGWAPIRTLALGVPMVVLLQVALGAMARHKAIGYIWHIASASIATGVILWATVRVLLQYAERAELRRGSLVLLILTFVQIFLGIAAYMSRIATVDAVQPMPVMVTFTVLHVATGALVMAASVLFAIAVRRNIASARPVTAGELAPAR